MIQVYAVLTLNCTTFMNYDRIFNNTISLSGGMRDSFISSFSIDFIKVNYFSYKYNGLI